MNINPESKPISEIFSIEGKTIYKIPIYQRNYSWNDSNIESLYNDVINEESGYYLGNLLVTPSQNKNEFDVVDGQQRLTTIALFLLAIYEELNNIDDKDSSKGQRESIYSLKTDIKRKLIGYENKPKLKLLEPDAGIFMNYLQVFEDKEKGKFGNRTFGKRYKFIQSLINIDGINDLDEIENFYKKLNNIELLRITVNDLTDAYSVFISLNAKGLPLTLIDLLKSYYLSEAVKDIGDSMALEEWNKLIHIFSNENGETNIPSITQFFQNNYDTFESDSTSSITKQASLRKYEKLFKEKKYKYIQTLLINAKIFSNIIPKIKSSDELFFNENLRMKIKQLSKLETSPIYPLMLFLLKKLTEKKISENTLTSIFDYLVSYYVRRNIVLKPKSSNIRAKAIQTVRQLEKIEDNLDDIALLTIKSILNPIKVSDEEFLVRLDESVYDTSPQTVRFILIEIERRYGNLFNKQYKDTLDDYENGKPIWTLEHVLPQNIDLKKSWKQMIAPDNIENAENLQKENMHRIGNITLTGYNSELSNNDFIEKRDYRPKGSQEYTGLRTKLFINKSIITDELTGNLKTSWTIQDIDTRTKKLADLVLKVFSTD